jgi:hypothetical protein
MFHGARVKLTVTGDERMAAGNKGGTYQITAAINHVTFHNGNLSSTGDLGADESIPDFSLKLLDVSVVNGAH